MDIEGNQYSGNDRVYQIVPSLFTVTFVSDYYYHLSGFVLNWQCYPLPPQGGTNGTIVLLDYLDDQNLIWLVDSGLSFDK